ncbi:MAG TPA: hypothetical protein PLW75_00555 [Hyphomicrobium sp.]|nr:hypothetical protein [Hyphomicrobium sp.]
MMACLALAAAFALGAGVVWLAQYVGPIWSPLSFSAAFLLLALVFKLISSSKDEEASENLEEAGQQASDAVNAVSIAAKTAAVAVPAKPSVLIPVLVAAGVLMVILGQEKRAEH